MDNETRISLILIDDGWSMVSRIIDAGDWKTASQHEVTISRNGQNMTTPYTMGAAHRVWSCSQSPIGCMPWNTHDKQTIGPMIKGKGMPYVRGRVSLHQEKVLLKCTEPASPSLADVMYSLALDASSVSEGQDFDSWTADFGFSSDSRNAERLFHACIDSWRSLIRLGADMDNLLALFQDY